jgi:two-component system response regulator ChvI
MVVDDEPDLLKVTKKMLQQNGYSVHPFNDPLKALDHVKKDGCKDCSIVISDIRMPGMSGFELVRSVKELRPEIKIILMTAFQINKEEAQMVLPSTPVDDFINKPFKTAELMKAIKNVFPPPNIAVN